MSEVLTRPELRGPPQRTDWFAVITELMYLGIPMKSVANKMGYDFMPETVLRHFRSGTEPLHWRGEYLLKFWCEVTGKHLDSRPMVDVIPRRKGSRLRENHPNVSPSIEVSTALELTKAMRADGAKPVLASKRRGRPPKVRVEE